MKTTNKNNNNKIKANDLIKILSWLHEYSEDSDTPLETTKNEKGFYKSEVYLPLLNATVIGLGDTKLESINNLLSKASKLIDEYVEDHPEIKLDYTKYYADYEIIEDENDNLCLTIKQSN